MVLTDAQKVAFWDTLWSFYATHARDNLPWRQPAADATFDAYKILVSELMLQQTQVARVVPKYQAFLQTFPTVQALATAELGEVLRLWQGLGYNRRAKYLWEAAAQLAKTPQPWSVSDLVGCKGIGPNTAGAVVTYAYDQPVLFIETNVRTVYIHTFFPNSVGITDVQILNLLEQTLPVGESYRQFYWALMDYGSHLKATVGNANKASEHYTKQASFMGSNRQVRGAVIRQLTAGPQSLQALQSSITDSRLPTVLQALQQEGLIQYKAGRYQL